MIKDRLVELGAVKFGNFNLSGGGWSGYYVDMKNAMTEPGFLSELGSELSRLVRADRIAGVELGAVPLVVATSLMKDVPYVIIRRDRRDHGVKDPVIGNVVSGSRIEIIEDVVTTGGSVIRAAEVLRDRGAEVERAICVVDREEGGLENMKRNGIELVSLVRGSGLLSFASVPT